MNITKKDKLFYFYEEMALKEIVGIRYSDNYIGESGAKDLIKRISRAFNMSEPGFLYTRKDSGFCYYRALNNSIYFNRMWGLTTPIVLHEMCHALLNHKNIPDNNHDKNFAREWIDIVSRMWEIEPEQFEKLADKLNVEYTPRIVKNTVTAYKPKYGN